MWSSSERVLGLLGRTARLGVSRGARAVIVWNAFSAPPHGEGVVTRAMTGMGRSDEIARSLAGGA